MADRQEREQMYRDLVAQIPEATVVDGRALAGTVDVIEVTEDVDGIPSTVDTYRAELVLMPEAFGLTEREVEENDG